MSSNLFTRSLRLTIQHSRHLKNSFRMAEVTSLTLSTGVQTFIPFNTARLSTTSRENATESQTISTPSMCLGWISDVIGLEGTLDRTGLDPIWMEWIQRLRYLEWTGSIRLE